MKKQTTKLRTQQPRGSHMAPPKALREGAGPMVSSPLALRPDPLHLYHYQLAWIAHGLMADEFVPRPVHEVAQLLGVDPTRWKLEHWRKAARVLALACEIIERSAMAEIMFRPAARKRGRPKKAPLGLLTAGMTLSNPQGKRGAPRKATDRALCNLLRLTALSAGELKRRRNAHRVTAKDAIEFFLEEHAKQNGYRLVEKRRKIGYWQKRHSEAKKKFPDLARIL